MALSRRGPRSRTRFTLLLLVLTSITLLTLDFRGFGPVESAHDAVLNVFAPVGDGAATVFRPVGNFWNGAFEYSDLQDQNKRLQQRVDELESQGLSNVNSQKELDQLKSQLNIPFVGQLETVKAQVSGGAIGNFEDTVEIDKGANDRIQKGMPVVSGSGLVGKVVRVTDNRAVVKLITNRDLNVGVKVPGKLGYGIATGTGEERRLTAEFNSKDAQVDVNDVLVTSGIQGSPYPAEIPVGKVTNVVQSDDVELRKSLDVELGTNLKDLQYLSVVLYTRPVVRDVKAVLRVTLVIFSAAVLYRGLFTQIRIGGVAVYVLLLVAIAAGIAGGADRGAVVGFFAGLAMDLLLPDSPFGLSALTFCIVGYIVGRYESSVTRSARWVVMLTAAVASAAGMILYIGLGQIVSQQNMLQRPIWVVLVVISVANALLAPLAVRIMRWALDLSHLRLRPAIR